jgi:hypothetical protein
MELVRTGGEIVISVSQSELRLLASSVGEALECVDAWEFQTRLGADPDDARRLRGAINEILGTIASSE